MSKILEFRRGSSAAFIVEHVLNREGNLEKWYVLHHKPVGEYRFTSCSMEPYDRAKEMFDFYVELNGPKYDHLNRINKLKKIVKNFGLLDE